MNAHGCPGLQNFYTCSAGDFKGCCLVNPCNTGVCPDEKANENQNQYSSESGGESEDTSTTAAETAMATENMNGPLMGTTMTAAPTNTDTRRGIGGATTTNAGAASMTGTGKGTGTGTGTTVQPQAGTVWSIPSGISGQSPRPALLGTPSRPDMITTTTGTGTSTSTNPSTSASPSSPTTSTTSLSPTEQIESAPSSPDSSPNTSSSGNGSNKALIGGVVGGILALGIILAVIFVIFCRRKKNKKRFTLLAWHGPQHVDREKGVVVVAAAAAGIGSGESLQGPTNYNHAQSQTTPTPISTTLPATSPNFNTHTPISTTHLLRTSTLSSPAPSFTSPFPERRHRHPLSPIPSIPSNPSLRSTLSSKHDMVLGIEQELGVHPALRGVSSETVAQTATGPERVTETGIGTRTGIEMTPELGDTGFYRQRAELATYSQSELINIPHERRHPIPLPTASPSSLPSPTSSSFSPDNHKSSTTSRGTKIITPEGVLLSANFERFPGCEDYATSFGQCFDGLGIQLVEEEVLPAYACDAIGVDEKRRESEGGGDVGP